MLSEKSGKILFAAVVGLLLFLFPVRSGAETLPTADRNVEKEFQEALKENKEYAEIQARSDSLRKQLDALREKLAADNQELKKLVEEQKKLRSVLQAPASEKPQSQLLRVFEIEKALNRAFSSSKEYAALSLRVASSQAETGYALQKFLHSSSDPRISKYNEFVEKYTDASFAAAAKNAPKANVEGSDEYKAAMYGVEKYKEDPARNMWAMVHGYSLLSQKMRRIAEKDPSIREMSRKLTLMTVELYWKSCLLQEKNPELAWKVKETQFSTDYKSMEFVKKSNELNNELWNILRADPGYAKLEKESQELRQAHTKAIDDFAAKSNAPEAVEYRKVKALLDEANKKASAGEGGKCVPARPNLDFDGFFTKTKYLQKDFDARELAMFKKYLAAEKVADPDKILSAFQGKEEAPLAALIKGKSLENAPVTNFFIRSEYQRLVNQTNWGGRGRDNAIALYELGAKFYEAHPSDRDEGQIILRRIPFAYDYANRLISIEKILRIEGLDPWLKEMFLGRRFHDIAWQARGHGFANSVTQNGWKVFGENIQKGKEHFLAAWKIDPTRPEAPAAICGAPFSKEDSVKYFRIASEIQADYDRPIRGLQNIFLPRWCGSSQLAFDLAIKCLESPFRDTIIPDRGIWSVCQGALEGSGYAWQSGIRNTPRLPELILKYLDEKIASKDPVRRENGMAQKICMLLALGHYEEADALYKKLTPEKFNAAIARFRKTTPVTIGGNGSYFSWIDYPATLSVFTGKIGKELKTAEDTFLAGQMEEALSGLDKLLARKDLSKAERNHLYFLYGHWLLNDDPSSGAGRIIPAWQVETWRKSKPVVMEKLLEHGIDPGVHGEYATCLQLAIYQNANPAVIMAAVKRFPDSIKVLSNDRYKRSVLYYFAEKNSDPALLKFLLENGADIEAKQEDGSTPLMVAIWLKNDKAARALTDAGASIHARNNVHSTVLHLAAVKSPVAFVKELIQKGADVNAASINDNTTPLMDAANAGRADSVRLLLENGAKVNKQEASEEKRTALHWAVIGKNPEVVKVLLEYKADKSLKDKNGLTPLELAVKRNLPKIAELLR